MYVTLMLKSIFRFYFSFRLVRIKLNVKRCENSKNILDKIHAAGNCKMRKSVVITQANTDTHTHYT